MTNEEKTQLVIDAKDWKELKTVIEELAPFVSNSRAYPIAHEAWQIHLKMEAVRKGSQPLTMITRVNGLRAKVAELIMEHNYSYPWE
jgi:hypothetical protein